MSRAFAWTTAIAGILGSLVGLTGCGLGLTGINGDTTLPDALSQLAQGAAADPTLSQLTVSDVVQGFEQYVQQFAGSTAKGTNSAAELTTDQQTQLQDLQGQLDRGEITQEQFAQQVQALIGNTAPDHAFAGPDMLGGPFPGNPVMGLADQLQLTDAQRQQAQDIFTSLHDDIATLRQNAQDQMKALLTADQLAQLDALPAQEPPLGGPHGGRMGPPPDPNMLPPDPNMPAPDPNMPPPPPGQMAPENPALGGLAGLANKLQLTDAQQTAIEQIRADLRTAVEARHQQARDEFRALLTADQLTLLDQIEAEHQPQ